MYSKGEGLSVSFSIDTQNPTDRWTSERTHLLNLESAERTHLLNRESANGGNTAEVSELLGPFKCPQNLEMAMPESQEDWSKEDIVQLLE